MRGFSVTVILVLSFGLTACEDPASNKPKAVTSNTASATRASLMGGEQGEVLTVDPDNSRVLFTGSKVTGRQEGGFNRFLGSIDLVNERPEESSVTIEIDTASVFTDADGLTKHLQSGDFLEVGKYPKATFVSTELEPVANDEYRVTGELELRGQKRAVTFPAAVRVTPEDVYVDAEFSINRKDFGILYAGRADDLIRDDVVIKLELRSPRKQ
jgi:polyisoprenoid-binding protein YceI